MDPKQPLKIRKYRRTQDTSYEDFIEETLLKTPCDLCGRFDECLSTIGEAAMLDLDNSIPCSMYDNTMDNLKKKFFELHNVQLGT